MEEQTCAECGVTDTEPMHIQYVAFSHPVTGTGTDLSVTKHVFHCDCPVCGADTERARRDGIDVEHGMREFLQNRPRDHRQFLFEQFSVESPDFEIPRSGEEE